MKKKWLFALTLAVLLLAPYVVGFAIQKFLFFASAQPFNNNVSMRIIDYQLGWLHSTMTADIAFNHNSQTHTLRTQSRIDHHYLTFFTGQRNTPFTRPSWLHMHTTFAHTNTLQALLPVQLQAPLNVQTQLTLNGTLSLSLLTRKLHTETLTLEHVAVNFMYDLPAANLRSFSLRAEHMTNLTPPTFVAQFVTYAANFHDNTLQQAIHCKQLDMQNDRYLQTHITGDLAPIDFEQTANALLTAQNTRDIQPLLTQLAAKARVLRGAIATSLNQHAVTIHYVFELRPNWRIPAPITATQLTPALLEHLDLNVNISAETGAAQRIIQQFLQRKLEQDLATPVPPDIVFSLAKRQLQGYETLGFVEKTDATYRSSIRYTQQEVVISGKKLPDMRAWRP